MSDQEMVFKVRVRDEASQQFAKIREEAVKTARAGSGSGSGSGGGGLGDLADSLGSRRALSRVIGGGVAGLVGSELAGLTSKAAEFVEEFKKGQLDAAGMAVKIGESLPILGGFVSAGQSIREMFTGEKAAIDRMNESSKITNDIEAARTKMLLEQHALLEEQAVTQRKLRNEAALVPLSGSARQYASTIQEKNDANANANAAAGVNPLNDSTWDAKGVPEELTKKLQAEKQQIAATIKELGDKIANPGDADQGDIDKWAADKQKLIENQGKLLTKVQQNYIAQQRGAAEHANQEAFQLQQDAGEEQAKQAATIAQHIADVQSEARESALRSAGNTYAAEIEALKRHQEDELAAIDDALRERRKKIANDVKGGLITQQAGDALKAQADADRDASRAGVIGETQSSAQKAASDEQNRQSDRRLAVEAALGEVDKARAAAVADGARAAIQADEQRLQIHQQILDVQKKIQDVLKDERDPARRQQLQAGLNALPGIEAGQQQNRIKQGIQSAAEAGLQSLADGGNRQAARALAKEQIEKQFKERRDEITAMLKDVSATAAQKQDLQGILGGLDTQQKSAMARAARDGIEYNPFAHTELNQGGNRGLAMAAREHSFQQQHDDPAARDRKEMVQLLKTIAGHAETTAKKEQAQPTSVLG